MILLLLAAAALVQDPLISTARARLSVPCEGADCAAPPAGARFRIEGADASIVPSKDRLFLDDGSKCNVVGARRCPKRGRTIFRTNFSQ